jgi:hypothetical protein
MRVMITQSGSPNGRAEGPQAVNIGRWTSSEELRGAALDVTGRAGGGVVSLEVRWIHPGRLPAVLVGHGRLDRQLQPVRGARHQHRAVRQARDMLISHSRPTNALPAAWQSSRTDPREVVERARGAENRRVLRIGVGNNPDAEVAGSVREWTR